MMSNRAGPCTDRTCPGSTVSNFPCQNCCAECAPLPAVNLSRTTQKAGLTKRISRVYATPTVSKPLCEAMNRSVLSPVVHWRTVGVGSQAHLPNPVCAALPIQPRPCSILSARATFLTNEFFMNGYDGELYLTR